MTTNAGVGLTYMFDQSFGLTLKAKRKVFSRDASDLISQLPTDGDYVNQFLFGFSYAFGNGDSDRDGVKDDVDACVNTPGLPELNGCPDDDGDGVRNSEDDCPDVPGLVALAGCPDMDGDTVADKYDSCPETPGIPALDGCLMQMKTGLLIMTTIVQMNLVQLKTTVAHGQTEMRWSL